jgi:RiboL-PSP-HEPN
MSIAGKAFDESIKDAEELLARYDEENSVATARNPEALKRAALVMALAAWETYVKDRFEEEFEVWLHTVKGSPVGKLVHKRKEEDLKRFYNPNSERTARLFAEYFEIDITRSWEWDNYKPADARKTLDLLIKKRGEAAHKANTLRKTGAYKHLIKSEELKKAIRFLKGLVGACEKIKILR